MAADFTASHLLFVGSAMYALMASSNESILDSHDAVVTGSSSPPQPNVSVSDRQSNRAENRDRFFFICLKFSDGDFSTVISHESNDVSKVHKR